MSELKSTTNTILTSAGNYTRSKLKSTISDCLNYNYEDKRSIRKKTPFYKDPNYKEFIPKFKDPNKNKLQTFSCFGNDNLKKTNEMQRDKFNLKSIDTIENKSSPIKKYLISNIKNETSPCRYNIVNGLKIINDYKNKTPIKTKELKKHPTQSNIFNDKDKMNSNNDYIHNRSNNLKNMYIKGNENINIISNKPNRNNSTIKLLNKQKINHSKDVSNEEIRSKSAFQRKIESLSKSNIFNNHNNFLIKSPIESEYKLYTINTENEYDIHNLKKEFLKNGLHVVNMKPSYDIVNNNNKNSISFALRKIKSTNTLKDNKLDNVIRKIFDNKEKIIENQIKTYFPKPLCPIISRSKSYHSLKKPLDIKYGNQVLQHSLTYKNLHVQSQISTKSNSKFSYSNSINFKKCHSTIKSK